MIKRRNYKVNWQKNTEKMEKNLELFCTMYEKNKYWTSSHLKLITNLCYYIDVLS